MKREGSEDEEDFEQHKQRRLDRIRDTLITQLRDYGQGSILVEIVKYLSVEEAYALSLMDDELRLYFHKNGVWEEYARDYLWRTEKVRLDDVISMFRFRVNDWNYLWVLICYIRRVNIEVTRGDDVAVWMTDAYGLGDIHVYGPDRFRTEEVTEIVNDILVRAKVSAKTVKQLFSNGKSAVWEWKPSQEGPGVTMTVAYLLVNHHNFRFLWNVEPARTIRSQLIGAGGTTKRERDEGEEKEYENCENEEDPLTHQPITELDPEAVVHIGPHCFDVEMIWFWVKRDPTNPITNERFTDEQVERIYEQYLRWSEVKLERQGHPLPRPIHRLLEIYYRAVEERTGERPRLLLTFVVGGQYYRLYTSPLESVQYLRQLVYNYILTRDPKIMIDWRQYYSVKPNPNIVRVFHGDRELLNDRRIEDYELGNNTLLTLGQTIMDPKPWKY
jgi:hypothetical protein